MSDHSIMARTVLMLSDLWAAVISVNMCFAVRMKTTTDECVLHAFINHTQTAAFLSRRRMHMMVCAIDLSACHIFICCILCTAYECW